MFSLKRYKIDFFYKRKKNIVFLVFKLIELNNEKQRKQVEVAGYRNENETLFFFCFSTFRCDKL